MATTTYVGLLAPMALANGTTMSITKTRSLELPIQHFIIVVVVVVYLVVNLPNVRCSLLQLSA